MRIIVIQLSQYKSFALDIDRLKDGLALKEKSSLRMLDPCLYENSVLCVGRRLKNSSLPLEKKHLIIGSGQSHFIVLPVLFSFSIPYIPQKRNRLTFILYCFVLFANPAEN